MDERRYVEVRQRPLTRTLIGLGFLGAGGLMAYMWWNKNKCSNLGAVECIDGKERVCRGLPTDDVALVKYLANTGNDCSGGGDDSPEVYPCSVEGAGWCNNGVHMVCHQGKFEAAGECFTETCRAIGCVGQGNRTECWGDDLYYDFRCDAVKGVCNPVNYDPNNVVCASRVPGSVAVMVNNVDATIIIPPDIYIDEEGPGCGQLINNYYPERVFVDILVKDSQGAPLPGATVRIDRKSECFGGFRKGDGNLACDTITLTSDENGRCRVEWIWTWTAETEVVRYLVTATKNGVSAQTYYRMTLNAGAFIGGWNCRGSEYKQCKP